MLDLKTVKNYLRVDYEEDDLFINSLIAMAEEFLFTFTKKVEEFSDKHDNLRSSNSDYELYSEGQIYLADMYCLALISEMYNNRGLTVKEAENKIRYVMQNILNQLRYD